MEDKIEKIMELITNRYEPHTVNWTDERSCGNYSDCFDDGFESGYSNALYEIGTILKMQLEYPTEDDEE